MAVPNYLAQVQKTKQQYPEAWRHAHTGSPQTWDFIRLLAADLYAIDKKFGLNGKRGDPNNLSQDAINYLGEGPGHDPITGAACTIIDVIAGAGGPNPEPSWQIINQPGPGAWVKPGGVMHPPTPTPTPTPVPALCVFPPRDQGLAFFSAINGKYKAKGRPATEFFIDPEGVAVWYAEYLRHRTAGVDHAEAQRRVFADIDAIWGK